VPYDSIQPENQGRISAKGKFTVVMAISFRATVAERGSTFPSSAFSLPAFGNGGGGGMSVISSAAGVLLRFVDEDDILSVA